MKKNKTKTENNGGRFCGILCVAVLAVFALFAACERPEPDPEPPTPPVVDNDTLPTNKFIGTWVLCAMNDVNSEPPATCDLADATTDTCEQRTARHLRPRGRHHRHAGVCG